MSGGVSRDFQLIPRPTPQGRVRLLQQLLTYLCNRGFDYPDHLSNRFDDSWSLRSSVLCSQLQLDKYARARPSEGRQAPREAGHPHAFVFLVLLRVRTLSGMCLLAFSRGWCAWASWVWKNGSSRLRRARAGLRFWSDLLMGTGAVFAYVFELAPAPKTQGATDTHAGHAHGATRMTRTARTRRTHA